MELWADRIEMVAAAAAAAVVAVVVMVGGDNFSRDALDHLHEIDRVNKFIDEIIRQKLT